jgi:hypothetical protein
VVPSVDISMIRNPAAGRRDRPGGKEWQRKNLGCEPWARHRSPDHRRRRLRQAWLPAPLPEFEAIITDEVAISAFGGHVRLAPGTYMVTIEHDERDAPDGARLVRVDVDGEPPIRLTRVQYGLLDGTKFFERR